MMKMYCLIIVFLLNLPLIAMETEASESEKVDLTENSYNSENEDDPLIPVNPGLENNLPYLLIEGRLNDLRQYFKTNKFPKVVEFKSTFYPPHELAAGGGFSALSERLKTEKGWNKLFKRKNIVARKKLRSEIMRIYRIKEFLFLGANNGVPAFIAEAIKQISESESYLYSIRDSNWRTPAEVAEKNYPSLAAILRDPKPALPVIEEEYNALRRKIIKKNADLVRERIRDENKSTSIEKLSGYLFSSRILVEIREKGPAGILDDTWIAYIITQEPLYKKNIWNLLDKNKIILNKNTNDIYEKVELENCEIKKRYPELTEKYEKLTPDKRKKKLEYCVQQIGLSKAGNKFFDRVVLLMAFKPDPTQAASLAAKKLGGMKTALSEYWLFFDIELLRVEAKKALLRYGGFSIEEIQY